MRTAEHFSHIRLPWRTVAQSVGCVAFVALAANLPSNTAEASTISLRAADVEQPYDCQDVLTSVRVLGGSDKVGNGDIGIVNSSGNCVRTRDSLGRTITGQLLRADVAVAICNKQTVPEASIAIGYYGSNGFVEDSSIYVDDRLLDPQGALADLPTCNEQD